MSNEEEMTTVAEDDPPVQSAEKRPRTDPHYIFLNLTQSYAHTWKSWDGVREFVQNWYDGLLGNLVEISPPSYGRKRLKITPVEGSKCKFEARLKHRDEDLLLGTLIYDATRETLNLINHNTALGTKVLLMGYSKKVDHHDIIGQFGEGLKVGALSLVRDKRNVMMSTSSKAWTFILKKNPDFEEVVLAVEMTARSAPGSTHSITPVSPEAIGEGDTCAQIWPIYKTDWESWVSRFLFLSPPIDHVETEIGSLLFDENLQGQLHVKQVWVSDHREDGLSAGVNFKSITLDRDRRAVLYQSEIDHLVNCMWAKALKLRPQLVKQYYQLLEKREHRDVRHAGYYLDESSVTGIIADEFHRLYGQGAIPVPSTSTAETLRHLSSEVQEKLILTNQTLVDILQRSGRVKMVEDVVTTQKPVMTKKRTLLTNFTPEQLQLVQEAESFVKVVLPQFSSHNLEFFDGRNLLVTSVGDSKYEVPSALLNPDSVHQTVSCPAETPGTCWCVPAFMSERIISSMGSRRNDPGDRRIQRLITTLALQAKGGKPREKIKVSDIKDLLSKNEEDLQKRIEEITEQLTHEQKRHQKELNDLQEKIKGFEDQLRQEDDRFIEKEQAFIERNKQERDLIARKAESALKEKEEEVQSLKKDYTDLGSQLEHEKRKRKEAEDKLQEEKDRHKNELTTTKQQCDWYLERLAKRVDNLSQIRIAGEAEQSQIPEKTKLAKLLLELRNQLKEDSKSDECSICCLSRKECCFHPCGHVYTCMACAENTTECPVCRKTIESKQKVYI